MDYSYLNRNVGEVNRRIADAAISCGRDPDKITLVAAVKYADADEVNYMCNNSDIRVIGENRVQQLMERWEKLDVGAVKIHFIGSLQTNKVKYIVDKVDLIHSLDSDKLAAEIDKQAGKKGIVARVLVEINSGNEESKGGIAADEAKDFCLSLAKYANIELCGFMTMAPRCENKNDYYGYFNKVKAISDEIWYNALKKSGEPIISMGMSESFEIAIECGATMVRVGRQLFLK